MKKLPCEKAIWDTIPIIRKELACCMVRDFGFSQKEAAKKLRITPAAISQYKCNKRADKEIKDLFILDEIKTSAKKIIRDENQYLDNEICRLCRLMNNNNPCPM